jgi:hypothetical protein
MDTCTWPLGNGETLIFTIFRVNDNWKKVAGLYIFAYTYNEGKNCQAIYIGQTDDFSSRIPCHEKWESAVQLGATHVHALVVPHAATRDTLERCLIAHLQPTLNEQYTGANYLSSLLNRS